MSKQSSRRYKNFIVLGDETVESVEAEIAYWRSGEPMKQYRLVSNRTRSPYITMVTPLGVCSFGMLADTSWWCQLNGEIIGAETIEDLLLEIQATIVDALQEQLEILELEHISLH